MPRNVAGEGERRFQTGEDLLRAMFFVNTLEPLRLAPVLAINSIETAKARHVFHRADHLSRTLGALGNVRRSARGKLRNRIRR